MSGLSIHVTFRDRGGDLSLCAEAAVYFGASLVCHYFVSQSSLSASLVTLSQGRLCMGH